ncbi:MAG: hypothetical protein AAGF90_20955 [Pseudomonadota bacterium]
MDDPGGRRDPIKYYGAATWIAGMALGAFLMWLLFAFAESFG